MIRKIRHRLASRSHIMSPSWLKRLNTQTEHHKSKGPSSLMVGSGVFAALIVGGVLGWGGATLMKPDGPAPSSPVHSKGMPPAQKETTEPVFSEQTLDELKSVTPLQQPSALPEVAALPPQTKIPEEFLTPVQEQETWQKNAVLFTPVPGVPMISIIIDDMGVDQRRSAKVMTLPGPLTGSFLSYSRNLQHQADAAHQAGMELMLHMPMEPMGHGYDPGPDVLMTTMTPKEMQARLHQSLSSFTGYIGINNHMGSKFTSCSKCMKVVAHELKEQGLIFVDSLTVGSSVGAKVAETTHVPNVTRNVFLDDSPKIADIRVQMKRLEKIARKHGVAIAIGHPRDTTIQALQEWLPTLKGKGFQLAPVSALVKRKYRLQ